MRRIQETENLSSEERQFLAEVKQLIRRFAPDAELLLYGSSARGSRDPESDYDLLVLLKQPLTAEQKDRIRGALYNIELKQNIVASVLFYTHDEWNSPLVTVSPYRKNVEHDGILI